MNVLVTGGAGFIGKEICKQLLLRKHTVRVADMADTPPDGVEYLKLDLTFQENADRAMKGMDACIHLAAKVGGVTYMNTKPATILNGSLKLLSTVFEAARKQAINRIIVASSSMVYSNTTTFPSKEQDIAKIPPPATAYGFSKLVTEYFAIAYWEEYQLPYTIIRPFNVYGVGAHTSKEVGVANVIPDFIQKALKGGPFEILGNGKQSRCFTHVTDMARAFVLALDCEKAKNEDFNIGSNEEITMLALAKKIWLQAGRQEPFEPRYVRSFARDVTRRVPDTTKAKEILGWQPTKNFDEGLKEMIAWMRKKQL